jgi:hypothetical protein
VEAMLKILTAKVGHFLKLFEKFELLLFRLTLLILFIVGLVKIVRSELGW